jgi:hypothetical protein
MNEIWLKMLPVIVGGGIAILGGCIAQLLAHVLSASAASKQKRLEKLEELVKVIFEHDEWLRRKQEELIFKQPKVTEARPLAKAQAITTVHLIELLPELMEHDNESNAYEREMAQLGLEVTRHNISNLRRRLIPAFQKYIDSRELMLQAIRVYFVFPLRRGFWKGVLQRFGKGRFLVPIRDQLITKTTPTSSDTPN